MTQHSTVHATDRTRSWAACPPQSHLEARLWNDVFVEAQAELGIPRGSIRVRRPLLSPFGRPQAESLCDRLAAT